MGQRQKEQATSAKTKSIDQPDQELHDLRIPPPHRERLPDTRHSITHKFQIDGHEGYLTVGLFPDGRPGELFIKMAKQGSTISGLVDTIGILTSLSLQYGVPIEALARKFEYMRFAPDGRTKNEEIHRAHSIVDYIFRWLGQEFSPEYQAEKNAHSEAEQTPPCP